MVVQDMVPSPIEYTVKFPTKDHALRCINRIVNSCQKMKREKITRYEKLDDLTYIIRPQARLQEHRIMPKIKIDSGEILDVKYEMVPRKPLRPGRHAPGYAETHPDRYDPRDFLACVEFTLDHPELFQDGRAMFYGDSIQMQSMRYQNFLHHGLSCVRCGIEGSFFLKQKSHKSEAAYHLNLYALREDGGMVLMTRDHIIPKSKGGPNTLENLQTMCGPCNWRKADTMPETTIDQHIPNGRPPKCNI